MKLDEVAPVITIQEKYAGMDWRDLRRALPGMVEADIVSKRNDKGEYIPYTNANTGNKVIVTKRALAHFKASETSNKAHSVGRQNTLHYEMIQAVPEIIKNGLWLETHMDMHGKADSVTRIIAPVKMNGNIYSVKLTVRELQNGFQIEGGEYTKFTAYDVSTKKEPVVGSNSTNSSSTEQGPLWPIPTTNSSTLSIREFLKHVNDDQGKPYINADGTPNYGIYFGNEKTGGVMFITPKQLYEQRDWRGSPYDFDTFDLGSIGSGEDNQVHNKYNQQMNGIRGAYDVSSGVLHLFDAANQSTFIHEAAHMWLSDVEAFAMKDDAPPKLVQDLQTIREWANYRPEQLEEYTGGNREKEFKEYAAAIEAARQSGDAVAIKAAEERWLQERFARAFERYIAEGKAPSQALQGPFSKFKKWLIAIYRDLTNLGKEPPEDVKRVMDRMVAIDEEIEVWAKTKELNAWERTGFSGDLSGPEGEKIQKWSDKIKEAAKEKLLADKVAELRQQEKVDLAEGWEQEKMSKQKELVEENPIYAYETIWNGSPETRPAILELMVMVPSYCWIMTQRVIFTLSLMLFLKARSR